LPIVTEIAAEHRMYLPLAIIVVVAAGAFFVRADKPVALAEPAEERVAVA